MDDLNDAPGTDNTESTPTPDPKEERRKKQNRASYLRRKARLAAEATPEAAATEAELQEVIRRENLTPAERWTEDNPKVNPRYNPYTFHAIKVTKPPEDMTAHGHPPIRGHQFSINGVDRSVLYGEPVALEGHFIAHLDSCMYTRYNQRQDPVTKTISMVERREPRFTYQYLGEVDAETAAKINSREITDPEVPLR